MHEHYRAKHRYWWATFKNGTSRFVFAEGLDAAAAEAAKLGEVDRIETLPYPSQNTPDGHPGFCFQPAACAGHSACPRRYACSE